MRTGDWVQCNTGSGVDAENGCHHVPFMGASSGAVRAGRSLLGAFGFAGPASGLDLVGQDRQVAEHPAQSRAVVEPDTTAPLDEFGITGSVLLGFRHRSRSFHSYLPGAQNE